MKALIVMCLSLFVFANVSADPRLNLDTNTCHFQKWKNDADDEWKNSCTIVLDEEAGQGAVAGHAVVKIENVLLVERTNQNGALAELSTRPGNYVLHSSDSGQQCVLRNDDGTETTTDEWAIIFDSVCYGNPNFCDYTYRIYCGYDEQFILNAYTD